jgi:lipoic acid synthetase
MILGDVCTRDCSFCRVRTGRPSLPDPEEPQRIVEAVDALALQHVVITSVTRDDLPDGGASRFARTTDALHRVPAGITVELLIPDFGGSPAALAAVLQAKPEVVGHNVETVPRLYPDVRSAADYDRSVSLLHYVKAQCPATVTKSGLMLGLEEEFDEVVEVMSDLRETGCDLLTIGQYLQPTSAHHPIHRFVTPEEFDHYAAIGREMGFAEMASAPLVRSSFRAAELYRRVAESPARAELLPACS